MQQRPATRKPVPPRESAEYRDKLVDLLTSRGGRLTRARRILLQVIGDLSTHFTPDDLARALRDRGQAMAMTTIYRNLPALEEAGLIARTTFREENRNGAATYEAIFGRPHHDHLVCRTCGKKVEFHYEALEVLQEEVARQHGFALSSHHLELVGLCPQCQTRKRILNP